VPVAQPGSGALAHEAARDGLGGYGELVVRRGAGVGCRQGGESRGAGVLRLFLLLCGWFEWVCHMAGDTTQKPT
jgi:hypothetical protein